MMGNTVVGFGFFKAQLESEMERATSQNGLKYRGAFVTDQFLKELVTQKNLKEYAEWKHASDPLNLKSMDYQRKSQLLDLICISGRKLFAILVLVDQPWHTAKLLLADTKIDDDYLFGPKIGGKMTYCALETFQSITELSPIAEECYKKQWHFPPRLSSDDIQSFPANLFMFPFVSVRPEPISHGSFGVVMEAEVAPGYITFPKGLDPVSKVAYKKIKQEVSEGWGSLKDEVMTLRARQHHNITPLVASFVAGLEKPANPNYPQQCLYMVSPLAEMDMNKWMHDPPESFTGLEDDKFRHHIYSDAMLGLARGVSYIHREIDGVVGYHRDLKPKNILLFARRSEWIWKICDFGCANLKPEHDTGTLNFATTTYWAPPEFFTDNIGHNGPTHGRAHDVYSLGCIFLLLATMLQHRWHHDGIRLFEEQRTASGDLTLSNSQTLKDEDRSAFHNSERAVRSWIIQLERDATIPHMKRILEVIKEMLLPREERISAWEADVYLYKAIVRERPESEVLRELHNVIQKPRDVDLQTTHTPMTRAIKWKQSNSFLKVLKHHRWRENSQ